MSIQLPNVINNISSSQMVTQNGQACVPANLLDANFQALANPVNPVIPITGSISLSTANSGNIYELNAPSANATIALPTPTNGFNAIFVGNNSSSYTYTFTTPSGNVYFQNTNTTSATIPATTYTTYFMVISDGNNWFLVQFDNYYSVTSGNANAVNGISASRTPIANQLLSLDANGRIYDYIPMGSVTFNPNAALTTTVATMGTTSFNLPAWSPSGSFKIICKLRFSMMLRTTSTAVDVNQLYISFSANTFNDAYYPVLSGKNGWSNDIEVIFLVPDEAPGTAITLTVQSYQSGGTMNITVYTVTLDYYIIPG